MVDTPGTVFRIWHSGLLFRRNSPIAHKPREQLNGIHLQRLRHRPEPDPIPAPLAGFELESRLLNASSDEADASQADHLWVDQVNDHQQRPRKPERPPLPGAT